MPYTLVTPSVVSSSRNLSMADLQAKELEQGSGVFELYPYIEVDEDCTTGEQLASSILSFSVTDEPVALHILNFDSDPIIDCTATSGGTTTTWTDNGVEPPLQPTPRTVTLNGTSVTQNFFFGGDTTYVGWNDNWVYIQDNTGTITEAYTVSSSVIDDEGQGTWTSSDGSVWTSVVTPGSSSATLTITRVIPTTGGCACCTSTHDYVVGVASSTFKCLDGFADSINICGSDSLILDADNNVLVTPMSNTNYIFYNRTCKKLYARLVPLFENKWVSPINEGCNPDCNCG